MGISLFSRMPALKYKRDFTHEQRVSFAFANSVDAAKRASSNEGKAASTPAEYKQNQCAAMGIGMGPRIHEECPYSAINHSYASTGSQALEANKKEKTKRDMKLNKT